MSKVLFGPAARIMLDRREALNTVDEIGGTMFIQKVTLMARMGMFIVGLAFASGAAGQVYPSKSIMVINPWTPGGPADFVARPMLQKLSEALGQSVVMDNRAGANGVIGSAVVAKAKPDGYTLLFSHVGPIAISPALQPMPYDSIKDFEPITQVCSGPTMLVVRPDLPIKTVRELIDYAKAHPGKLSYGSVGPGSTTHLGGEMLGMMSGTKMLHVPYKGAAPVITDLLGKHIDFAFINISGAVPHVQAGKLRAVAVSTLKRSSLLPDLPTVAETLPGFEVNSWYGMMAPAGTPKEIINRLYTELAAIIKSPAEVERLKHVGLDVEATTPQEHAAKIKDDLTRWAKIVKATGVTVSN